MFDGLNKSLLCLNARWKRSNQSNRFKLVKKEKEKIQMKRGRILEIVL